MTNAINRECIDHSVPADFKVKQIKTERELRRDPNYRPDFSNVPLRVFDLEVALDSEQQAMLQRLVATGRYRKIEAEVPRYVFFTWRIGKFMHGPKHARSL